MFSIIKKDNGSRARVGVIKTAHGEIETPAFVMVATHGTIKTLTNEEVYRTGTQVLISNTFHLWREALTEIKKAGSIHEQFGWVARESEPRNGHKLDEMPMMTDSGGFQVFSYGFSREHDVGKVVVFSGIRDREMYRRIRKREGKDKNMVTIADNGVRFSVEENGQKKFAMLTPARSIEIQKTIGADMIFAFDECTSPFHDYEYVKKALERTHAWAKICRGAEKRSYQKLYGVIQGGRWRDLREKSATFINSLDFDAYGIGGSFGHDEMRNTLDWTIPLLDERKPRHLLGIGLIQDIFDGISRGVDSFDCVIPTREARHGSIWTGTGRYDVRKAEHAIDIPLERGCECDGCQTTTRKQLREMFKTKDANAGRVATIHNMFFFNRLMADAREAIREGRLDQFKNEAILRSSTS